MAGHGRASSSAFLEDLALDPRPVSITLSVLGEQSGFLNQMWHFTPRRCFFGRMSDGQLCNDHVIVVGVVVFRVDLLR
jgi:hypothetical protein